MDETQANKDKPTAGKNDHCKNTVEIIWNLHAWEPRNALEAEEQESSWTACQGAYLYALKHEDKDQRRRNR